jgi:hypothetical protein
VSGISFGPFESTLGDAQPSRRTWRMAWSYLGLGIIANWLLG